MTAAELITEEIPPLLHTDNGDKALVWMDEFKVSHLPVLKNGNYVGIISESALMDMEDLDISLDKLFQHLPRPYVFKNAHIYEVLARISDHKVSVMPILDNDESYLGCTDIHHLMTLIANTGSIKDTGGILIIEMNEVDYSMAQIAQIVESNGAKILSSFIMTSKDTTKVEVTLKINEIELDRIIRTFERYDIQVKATFQKGRFDDDYQLRYDALMNYLKM
jgi:acetoin utilization protein AcuB